MARDIQRDNEIFFGDTYFPTIGPVRTTNISVTPNPLLFGDTSRQGDTQAMSQLIQSGNTGGSGVYKGNPRTDVDRFWKSRAETRYRQFLCLPPLTVSMGKPASLTTEDCELSIDYRNVQYFSWAGKVFSWADATSTWSAIERTLGSTCTSAVVYKDVLYMAYGTNYDTRTSAGVWAVGGTAATYFVVWDQKLWKLYQSAGLWTLASSTDGAIWSASQGTLPQEVNPTQLVVFRDVSGASVIYAVTDAGLYIHDDTNDRFLETEVKFPRVRSTQTVRGSVFRDGKLYLSSGDLGMLGVQGGNPIIITPAGLDMDDGVPTEDSGYISALAAEFNWMLALIDGSTTTDSDDRSSGLGSPFDSSAWDIVTGQSTMRAWNGGWHTLWQSNDADSPGSMLSVSSAYSKRRVYWSGDGVTYYQTLPSGVHNPRQNLNPAFEAGPVSHITSWSDYGASVQQKHQGHVSLFTKQCSATEKVSVYYATDLDDENWTLLGTITTNGLHTLKPGGAAGIQANYVRFRIDLERGADSTLTPIVEFWASEFMRLLPATYGFAMTVDLSRQHRDKNPAQLLAALKRLADPDQTPLLQEFCYQDDLGNEPQTYYGRITRLSGHEHSGTDLRGLSSYQVSVVVPYTEDTI